MALKKVSTVLKLFESPDVDEEFLVDLRTFADLPPSALAKILAYFTTTSRPFHRPSKATRRQLATAADIPYASATRLARFLPFLIGRLVDPDYSIDDLVNDLRLLQQPDKVVTKLRRFLDAVVSAHPDLRQKVVDLALSSETLETVEELGFSIDFRGVFDDEANAIKRVVPILIVSMVLGGGSQKHNVVFQLNIEKLEQLLEMFAEQRLRLQSATPMVQVRTAGSQ